MSSTERELALQRIKRNSAKGWVYEQFSKTWFGSNPWMTRMGQETEFSLKAATMLGKVFLDYDILRKTGNTEDGQLAQKEGRARGVRLEIYLSKRAARRRLNKLQQA